MFEGNPSFDNMRKSMTSLDKILRLTKFSDKRIIRQEKNFQDNAGKIFCVFKRVKIFSVLSVNFLKESKVLCVPFY